MNTPQDAAAPNSSGSKVTPDNSIFLPDFCTIRMVFVVVIIAELFAFVLAFYPLGEGLTHHWQQLSLTSLFIQWCALSSCAVLCVLRKDLARFSNLLVGLISYVIIILLVLLISVITYKMLAMPDYGFIEVSLWQFIGRNVSLAAVISGPILHYFYIQHQWQQKVKAEEQARFAALQARIQPHFLFNSLNTIASLVQISPHDAEMAVENLSDLFRVSMRQDASHHTLVQECELCQRYLQIESLRLAERLNIEWDIDGLPDDAIMPPLLLQPLLENAIYHGIERLPEGGTVHIEGHVENKNLSVTVTNPVVNCDVSEHPGNHMAQENIRQRINTFYNSVANLNTQCENNIYTVNLIIPYINQYENPDS